MAFGNVGGVLAISGAINSAIGSYYSTSLQKINLKHQAAMAEINARIAETGAQSALYQGQQQAGALTLRAGQVKSSQRAAMAANGVDLGEGNAAEVQASTDILKEIDANTINANAVRNAWGLRLQGANYQNEATMASASAGAINPGMSAATTLLGSAGSVAQSWYNMSKVGMFNTPSNGSFGGGSTPGFSGGDLGNGLRY